MENIKVLMKYSDWMKLNRGRIEPHINDRVVFHPFDKTSFYVYTKEDLKDDLFNISDYFIEVEYNPKEIIETTINRYEEALTIGTKFTELIDGDLAKNDGEKYCDLLNELESHVKESMFNRFNII